MIVDTRFTKKVDSYVALQRESSRVRAISESDLTFTLCDRSSLTDKKGNYFLSFNLPYKTSALPTTSTISKLYPELQQLNVDQIIITPIPTAYYSEFIDGRTVSFTVPVSGSTNPNLLSGVTLISSTYTSVKPLKSESNILLGDNVVFLFSDDINRPYTGKTRNEIDDVVDNVNNTSWNPTGEYKDRPGATSYIEIKDKYNTDTRSGNSISYAVSVPAGYPDNRDGYNYDIPCGFAVLDRGFMVITHPQIVNNFPWTSGLTESGAQYVDDFNISSKTNIHFTGSSYSDNSSEGALLSFQDIDTSFKMTSVCIALPQEFYISNNPTWDKEKAISQINGQEGYVNFDSVYVTEIGLYNAFGEMVAVGKLSEPVEKTYVNAITFEINLEM
jgi:hypothetical protein